MAASTSPRGSASHSATAAALAAAAAAAAAAKAADEAAERTARLSISKDPNLTRDEAEDALIGLWVGRAAPFLRLLGDVNRFRIVLHLRKHGESDVTTMAKRLAVPQSRLSQHLGRLSKANLVFWRREGQRVIYTLNREYLDWKLSDLVSHVRE